MGQETKKGVTGQGYIGGGFCHVHHVCSFILVIIFCYKNSAAPSCGRTVSWSTDAWWASWWLEKACRICGMCVCGSCVRRASMYVRMCVSESVLGEGFHVSSTVTVRTSAIHVSPSMSMREAPSTNTKETFNQTRTPFLSLLFINQKVSYDT